MTMLSALLHLTAPTMIILIEIEVQLDYSSFVGQQPMFREIDGFEFYKWIV